MSKLVEITRFLDPEEAYCAKGYLKSYGIDVIVQNEYHLTTAPWLRFALGGYPLLILSKFEDEARQALSEVSPVKSDRQNLNSSPHSDASELQERKGKNWFWLPAAFLLGVPFVPRKKSGWNFLLHSFALVMLYGTVIYSWVFWFS
ncbi:MAG: hypothetical protein GXP06_07415 [Alphaproteobacteria bacterium]|nr:hypothetical protein [Alphaproteobacteria bacterium]